MDPDFYARYFELEDRHWWFLGRRRIIVSEIERALPAGGIDDRRLLDVGCGTGTMLRELARFGTVQGVDAEEQAVAFCRRRGMENVDVLRDHRLPFPDASFDVVSAFDVLEHLDDDGAMAAEMRRVLRPAGLLVVTVPAYRWMWGPQDEISHHRRRYVRSELEGLIRGARFRLQRTTYFNTLLLPPIAAVRVLRGNRRKAGDPRLRSDFELGHPAVNGALARILAAEELLLRRGHTLPFGVSILAIARPTDAG